MSAAEKIMPDFTGRRYKFHYLTALNLLGSMGVPADNIYIRAVGTYENYMGEVRTQDPPPGEPVTSRTKIVLEIGHHSAVDFMPYQFFYGLKGLRDTGNKWEEDARSLMAPFDAAVIRYDAAIRFHALRYEFGVIEPDHLHRFMELFEYDARDETGGTGDMMLMASILPSLFRWGGNPGVVSSVLRRLFGYRFQLRENVKASTRIPEELRYRLGSKTARLGSETILGRSFEEFDSTYEVEISGVRPEDVPLLLPGGAKRRKIEKLLEFCMPGDLDYRIRIRIDRKEALSSGKRYLGYTSFVSGGRAGIS